MNNKSEPFVSVVTPFYNTDQYLAQCIESVLAQTYQNWEYILVNNCSTDKSMEIANKYIEKDVRIKLINNNTFFSQVKNYNHALRQISSSSMYCKMVQADDWIFPECLAEMVSAAEKDQLIGVVAGYRLQGEKITNHGLPYCDGTILGKDVCKKNLLLDGSQIFGSPTTVLFKSEIVRYKNPFFCETDYFEDSDVCFDLLKTWNFAFVFQVLVFERTENESISSGIAKYDPSWMLAKLIRVSKYGKTYLNEIEFETRYKTIYDSYFNFLSKNILFNKNNEFFAYHRKGLATIDLDLRLSLLKKYIFLEILDLLFNPKATAGKFYRYVRNKFIIENHSPDRTV